MYLQCSHSHFQTDNCEQAVITKPKIASTVFTLSTLSLCGVDKQLSPLWWSNGKSPAAIDSCIFEASPGRGFDSKRRLVGQEVRHATVGTSSVFCLSFQCRARSIFL
eukprot:gb/GEZJ01010800.1/.p1 GENE.gb/GEZJ01010800.1/~~gb/GEZJ01010800.1/.p1  ORF type:complete len:107 (-),score=1.46 gb/GEZJ01010800.1/:57-377(-)